MRASRGRWSPLLVAGVALSVAATGCGGSGRASPTPVAAADETTTTVDPGGAYAACLRSHGVDAPDRPPRTDGAQGTPGSGPPASRPPGSGPPGSRPPGSGPPGSGPPGSGPPGSRPSTTLPAGVDQAAFQAARAACQSLLPTDRANGAGSQGQAFQAYASCMKDHGVVLPAGGGFGGVNRDDATFKAADAICAVLRPS